MMDPVHPWVDPGEMRRLAEALMTMPVSEPRAPDDAGFGNEFIGFAGSGERAAATLAAPVVDQVKAAEQVVQLPTSPVPKPAIIAPAPLQPLVPIFTPAPTVPPQPVAQVVISAKTPPEESLLNGAFRIREKSMLEQIAASSPRQPEPPAVVAPPVTSPPPALTAIAPKAAAPPLPQEPQPTPAAHTAPVKVRGPFLERMSRFRDGLHGQFAAKGVFILDKDGSVIFDESDHSRLHFMARSLAMAAKKSSDGPGNVHVKVGSTTMLEVIPVDTVFGRMVLGMLVEQPLASESVVRIIKALQSMVAPPTA